MHYNMINATLVASEPWQGMDALSLYHVFEQLSDKRHPRGKRYSLALVLSLLILGKLAGMPTLTGITKWVRWRARTIPMRSDLQQCLAGGGYPTNHAGTRQLADATGGRSSRFATPLLSIWLTAPLRSGTLH